MFDWGKEQAGTARDVSLRYWLELYNIAKDFI